MATADQRAEYTRTDPTFAKLLEAMPPRPSMKGAVAAEVREMTKKAREGNTASLAGYYADEDFSNVEQKEITIPGRDGVSIPARLYQPKVAPKDGSPLVDMMHGGGFCFGDIENEDLHCRLFVKEFGAVVLNVLYRLAPEHPFPAAVDDAWDALKWIAANAKDLKATPSQGFIVGGTSAGGNLTDVVGHLARDEKLDPPLTGLLELIPSICSAKVIPEQYKQFYTSHEENANAAVLPQDAIDWFHEQYKPDLNSKLYSPFNWLGGHKGLPPISFQVCGADMLRDGALIYEKVLREELGMKTWLKVYPGLPHGFWSFFPMMESSKLFPRDTVEALRWLLEQKGRQS